MKCPECKSKKTRVSSTDHHPIEDFTNRYCKCLSCGISFTTIEKYSNTPGKPGRRKENYTLNDHQCTMIAFNNLNLTHTQWADVYNVSPSVISAAKKRIQMVHKFN